MDDATSPPPKASLLERLSALIMRQPEDRGQLIDLLHSARDRDLLDAEALAMIEGVMQTSELAARDIMVPRAQMDVIDINEPLEKFISMVIETGHSRFPVIERNRDEIIGILMAKDLLRVYTDEELKIRELLRPAVFIPESKRLNDLLRQFRANRNHLAIVVDEYGGAAGLVTIEDVLEQIVGEIDDEFDFDEAQDNILIDRDGRHRVRALTEIEDFNRHFGATLSDADADTIGGLVTHRFGRVPQRGESVVIDGFKFQVLRSDSRQVHILRVDRVTAEETAANGA
jgi:magnesium and cobalt transporter